MKFTTVTKIGIIIFAIIGIVIGIYFPKPILKYWWAIIPGGVALIYLGIQAGKTHELHWLDIVGPIALMLTMFATAFIVR